MGCDIHVYVEVDKASHQDETWWKPAGNLSELVGRSYDVFGCLFGVRNYTKFEPIAPKRGIPDDISRTISEEYQSWGSVSHSSSYLTYDEIQQIDWQETAEGLDSRYSFLDKNKEPTGTKAVPGPASGWYDIIEENKEAIDAGEAVPNEAGDMYIQRRRLTRESSLSGAWEWLLHDYMGLLADRYGDENVRMVVWFDN